MLAVLATIAVAADGVTLPDDRGYELVSNIVEPGGESLLDGANLRFAGGAVDGDALDWVALGACCGAGTGGLNTYQSVRGSSGWTVHGITPVPKQPLRGLAATQAPEAWSEDLTETLFSTAASYARGDQRPEGSEATELYLQEPDGEMRWISQGPLGEGAEPDSARFDGATPTLNDVVFSTSEPLTSNATGLDSASSSAAYLYLRNLETEETTLVDMDNAGAPISPYGASFGSEPLGEGPLHGNTLNAISASGAKVFFETPAAGAEGLPEGVAPHLYVRDLETSTTTPLDDPALDGTATYQGASSDGSLAFFTSDEGLDGASTANELYEFNTTSTTVGDAPPEVAIPLAGGTGVLGVVAIANDGTRIFFAARTVLAGNRNPAGNAAIVGEPNLYAFDGATGHTEFIATLSGPDVSNCEGGCAHGGPAGLLNANAAFREAYPTPTGSTLAFTSSANLTGQSHVARTTLTSTAGTEAHTLDVANTNGFHSGGTVVIGTDEREEIDKIETIDGKTEMTLSAYEPGGGYGLLDEHAAGARVEAVDAEIYRYSSAEESLVCVSCTPEGTQETQSANLGEARGGSYAPDGRPSAMSEDGSRIFFDSPDPLAPAAGEPDTSQATEATNLYEWEDARISLIAGAAVGGAELFGTTPSGSDVFFSSLSSLLPGAQTGFQHIYDARIGGGAAAPTGQGPGPCATETCRTQPASTAFTPPASEVDPEGRPPVDVTAPSFTVAAIYGRERAALSRSGRLRLVVKATAASVISAVATAEIHGKRLRVAGAWRTLATPGRLVLTLHLDSAARALLARAGRLAVQIEIRYARSGATKVLKLMLRRGPEQTRRRRWR
jgi:hypothetical protein